MDWFSAASKVAKISEKASGNELSGFFENRVNDGGGARDVALETRDLPDWKVGSGGIIIKQKLPREGGEWVGERGDSLWKPNPSDVPSRPPGNEDAWVKILERYEIEGIEFKDGEPDFTPVSEGTVEIRDFSKERVENFTQADERMAENWNQGSEGVQKFSPQDVKEYRKENNLSWHERSDMKTMDLVPQEVHGNVPHSGGISEAQKNSA